MRQTKAYRYKVVDVFAQTPLEGNPLAVFADAAELDSCTMQKIARELNLSETVFIVPAQRADCVARFRIFTPRKEMDFAGHPTVGASFILVHMGFVSPDVHNFYVEENVGAVPIAIDPRASMFWLRNPPVRELAKVDRNQAAALIGLSPSDLAEADPQILSAGNPTLFVPLKDRSLVDQAFLNTSLWTDIKRQSHPDPMCTFVFAPTTEGAYSRMFAPDYGIAEDPATGSSTGPLAYYMTRNGMTSSLAGSGFISEQGTQMGRRSLLHVRLHGEEGKDGIDVGGFVTPVINGELRI